MPGRRCTICDHKHRGAIDGALLSGARQHAVATEHGVSRDAVSRHFLKHLPVIAATDQVEQENAPTDGRLDIEASVTDLRVRLLRLLGRAERSRDLRAAILCVREAARLLELSGRMSGQIDASGVKIAMHISGNDGNAQNLRERIAEKMAAICGPVPPMIDGVATEMRMT